MTESALEDLLSLPNQADRDAMAKLTGTLLMLGVGGKMGPSLAFRARRAAPASLRIVAVARFSDRSLRQRLDAGGIETIEADLLAPRAFDALPDAENVINLAARKFGTSGDASPTWATNTVLPAMLAERYAGSQIISWSTGNVYPFTPAGSGGATEQVPLAPVGEYGNSALARERIFEYYSRRNGTRVCLLRLNYAVEPRYGVLTDVARKVFAGEPVDVTMGYANVIWQGDANSICLRAFPLCSSPPAALNVTGLETLAIRDVARRFGELLGRPAVVVGQEAPDALLSNAGECARRFGPPSMTIDSLMEMIADWIQGGGVLWDKPTHFEVRDGKF